MATVAFHVDDVDTANASRVDNVRHELHAVLCNPDLVTDELVAAVVGAIDEIAYDGAAYFQREREGLARMEPFCAPNRAHRSSGVFLHNSTHVKRVRVYVGCHPKLYGTPPS